MTFKHETTVDRFLDTPGTLPTGYTLTRASLGYDGSFVDAAGSHQSAAAGAARWTYDPVSLALRGLLNEPQRSNLQDNAQQPRDNSGGYSNTPGTITVGSGTLVGLSVSRAQATPAGFVGQGVGAISSLALSGAALPGVATLGRTFVASFYAANNGGNATIRLQVIESPHTLVTIVKGTATLDGSRVEIAHTLTEDDVDDLFVFLGAAETAVNYDYFHGLVQVEEIAAGEEAAASSWIPTVTATLTRARDILTRTGLENGVYDVTIVRDGVADEVLLGQIVTDGTFEVPTSVYPIQSITFNLRVDTEELERQTQLLAEWLSPGRVFAARNIATTRTRALLQGLARELLRSRNHIETFRRELIPSQTSLLIGEWEQTLGIPDDCFRSTNIPLAERQQNVVAKLTMLGAQTVEDFEMVAIALGFDVTVLGGAGLSISPGIVNANIFPLILPFVFFPAIGTEEEARHTIVVIYQQEQQTLFPYTFPIPLGDSSIALLQCVFRKMAPANVNVLFIGLEPTAEPPQQLETAWLSPANVITAGTLEGEAAGSIGWSNPSNAAQSDDQFATASMSDTDVSEWLIATDFSADIPDGAVITGIEARAEVSTVNGNAVEITAFRLAGLASTSDTEASALTVSDTIYNRGGVTVTWGAALTEAIVEGSGFGVGLMVTMDDVGQSDTVRVDHIQIKIHYQVSA